MARPGRKRSSPERSRHRKDASPRRRSPDRRAHSRRSPVHGRSQRSPERKHARRDRSNSPDRRRRASPAQQDGRGREERHENPARHHAHDASPARRRDRPLPQPQSPPGPARPPGGEERGGGGRGARSRFDEEDAPALPGPPPRHPAETLREAGGTGGGQANGGEPPEGTAAAPAANFGLSGKLAEETNTVRGVVLLHAEPPEARKPPLRWRLYTFKNGEPLGEPLYIHRQSCYLFGRERRVADVPTDHPSCSKQHAVLQFRATDKPGPNGMPSSQVRPYLMDLGSTNGSFLNNERLEVQRYYELYEKDMLRFGNSSREYILLHDRSLEAGA